MENTQSKNIPLGVKRVNNKGSNSEIIRRIDVKDTPFEIIVQEGKAFGVMGKYRITEAYEKESTVHEELKKVTWNRIVQIIMLLWEQKEENKITTKKEK